MREQNKLNEAAAAGGEALAIARKIHGEEHIDTLNIMEQLASVLLDKRDYAGADPLFRRVLEVTERTQGKEGPDTLRIVEDLAVCLAQKRDYAEAEDLPDGCWRRESARWERQDRETLKSLNNLGVLLVQEGKQAEGERAIREALTLRKKVLGSTHPDVAKLSTVLPRRSGTKVR